VWESKQKTKHDDVRRHVYSLATSRAGGGRLPPSDGMSIESGQQSTMTDTKSPAAEMRTV